MKILEFHLINLKIIKILEFHAKNENLENHRIPLDNHENHENIKIP